MARLAKSGNWQAKLDTLLQSSKDCGLLKDFKDRQTDADRIRFIHENKLLSNIKWLKDYFSGLCQTFHRKDAERAKHHKQEGNKLFLARKDKQALQSYTLSMQFAPCELENDEKDADLSLAYGNRSAVLFHLHEYQDCLKDIERALAAGFPKQSYHKLLVRRCLCHCRLHQKNQAVSVQESIANLMESCDEKTLHYLEGEMVKIKEEIESLNGSSADKSLSPGSQTFPEPSVSYSPNGGLVQASSAVEMKMSPTQGRFLQAKHAIKAGDTLIVERPFAAVLLPPHYSSHCLHCFVVLPQSPVGCQQCSGVLYCSETCRVASWETYHCVECRYMDLLHSVGIAHLSLRIVLTVGLSGLTDFLEKRKQTDQCTPDRIPGVTEDGYYERNYLSVYDLMTHTEDMIVDDLFQYSLTATLLLGVLLHCGWLTTSQEKHKADLDTRSDLLLAFLQGNLKEKTDVDLTKVFTVGGVLLRHVQQLVCNAHAITALQATQVSEEHLVETQSQVRVATAIYPTASLMNHSCDPTIISSFQRDVLIVKSVKDLTAGEEIFNCYGPHCKRMRRPQRQEELRTQYFFSCQCQACVNDLENETGTDQELLCPKCGHAIAVQLICPACHEAIDVEAILSELDSADTYFREGAQHLELEDYDKALIQFKKCLKIRSKVMSSNNHDLGEIHDAIAQCLASKGLYSEAAKHLTHSLAVTEAIFGADSIEIARELQKTAEVLIHAERPKDALGLAARSLDIAKKLCSDDDHWVQELLSLNTVLTKITEDPGGMH